MPIDLTDTTTGAIYEALTDARSRLGGAALGMVLTLVVETDEAAQYDAMRAANDAGREHPCRVLERDHPPPERRVAAGRRDPGGRSVAPGRRCCCACTARWASTRTP